MSSILKKDVGVILLNQDHTIAVISVIDHRSYHPRTTYIDIREHGGNEKRAAAEVLRRIDAGSLHFDCDTHRSSVNEVVGVKVDVLKQMRPDWFVDPDTALKRYEDAQRYDRRFTFSDDEKKVASEAWSARLRELQNLSKQKERMSVVCDGNFVQDHEGVPIKELGERS